MSDYVLYRDFSEREKRRLSNKVKLGDIHAKNKLALTVIPLAKKTINRAGIKTDAEDVLQDVFIALVAECPKWDIKRSGFTTYAMFIIRRVITNYLKNKKKTDSMMQTTPSLMSLLSIRGELEPYEETEKKQEIENEAAAITIAFRYLDGIDKEQKEVVMLRLAGYSWRRIERDTKYKRKPAKCLFHSVIYSIKQDIKHGTKQVR